MVFASFLLVDSDVVFEFEFVSFDWQKTKTRLRLPQTLTMSRIPESHVSVTAMLFLFILKSLRNLRSVFLSRKRRTIFICYCFCLSLVNSFFLFCYKSTFFSTNLSTPPLQPGNDLYCFFFKNCEH